mgnify:CR=1 FL=1
MMPMTNNRPFYMSKCSKNIALASKKQLDKGVALFIAISFLALFSVLGASYMRFMSLELDETELRIRDMRIRQYATAGINEAAGNIRSALLSDKTPRDSYTFAYAVYGESQEKNNKKPQLLSTYTAQVQATLQELDKAAWDKQFPNADLSFPGPMRVFRILSQAALQRAVPGGIITLTTHAQTAVLVMQGSAYHFLSWQSVVANDTTPQKDASS